jgi:hypothetical protein
LQTLSAAILAQERGIFPAISHDKHQKHLEKKNIVKVREQDNTGDLSLSTKDIPQNKYAHQ